MGEYVDLPGVKTWYEVEGKGEAVVLLHGGLCTNDTWDPQRPALAARFRVYLPERRAHGHTPDVQGPLSYADMTTDTADFLAKVVGGPAHLVGWSDGAIVALLTAIARPDLVKKLVVIGANYLPAPESAAEPAMLDEMSADSPGLEMFRTIYEKVSPDGPEHWPAVVERLGSMWSTEPNISDAELARITAPTLVLVGDDDMVSLEHTVGLYRAVPNAELAIVPGASHALLMEKTDLANQLILDFLGNEPVPTMFPIRRAATDQTG